MSPAIPLKNLQRILLKFHYGYPQKFLREYNHKIFEVFFFKNSPRKSLGNSSRTSFGYALRNSFRNFTNNSFIKFFLFLWVLQKFSSSSRKSSKIPPRISALLFSVILVGILPQIPCGNSSRDYFWSSSNIPPFISPGILPRTPLELFHGSELSLKMFPRNFYGNFIGNFWKDF